MIYVDENATTRPSFAAFHAMRTYFFDNWYNPQEPYQPAVIVHEAIEKARKQCADSIGASPDEIYFTSGATESNNWAIKGFAFDRYVKNNFQPITILTDTIEHHSVLNSIKSLEELRIAKGLYVPVTIDGFVDPSEVLDVIKDHDIQLASVMLVNNELGSINDCGLIGEICKTNKVAFHVDATQAYGKIPVNVEDLKCDMLSVSAHKVHGVKGVGFLYIRKGFEIAPLISGGQQENGMRAGTENVPGIMAFGAAAEVINKTSRFLAEHPSMDAMKSNFIRKLKAVCPRIYFNSPMHDCVANTVNISFVEYHIKGEELVEWLSQNEIYCSSGSACNSLSDEPSHVLIGIRASKEEANSSVRFSFPENITDRDIKKIVSSIKSFVDLRASIAG